MINWAALLSVLVGSYVSATVVFFLVTYFVLNRVLLALLAR
jgi:hypothetical protein